MPPQLCKSILTENTNLLNKKMSEKNKLHILYKNDYLSGSEDIYFCTLYVFFLQARNSEKASIDIRGFKSFLRQASRYDPMNKFNSKKSCFFFRQPQNRKNMLSGSCTMYRVFQKSVPEPSSLDAA